MGLSAGTARLDADVSILVTDLFTLIPRCFARVSKLRPPAGAGEACLLDGASEARLAEAGGEARLFDGAGEASLAGAGSGARM